MLATELTRQDEVWQLKLNGNLDSQTASLMWPTDNSAIFLQEMVQAQVSKLIIDLTDVEFIDSHGLRVLLNAHKDFSQESIQITLQNPNSHLRRLLRIMQFDRVFEIK